MDCDYWDLNLITEEDFSNVIFLGDPVQWVGQITIISS